MKKKQKPLSPIKVAAAAKHKEMRALGINVSKWARDNGFSRDIVVGVLRGQSACLHGKAHAVAVALGIKQGVVVQPGTYCPAQAPVDAKHLKRAQATA